ncbi:hypothetical protein [Solirhodobacter olei]|uniref:hypothetical protein n=1 Tax=Solirhodobacter olei TaxID=2493082 RepID=UPI000FD9428E|nr:hypothetical protein [Solirhodobacter olei]
MFQSRQQADPAFSMVRAKLAEAMEGVEDIAVPKFVPVTVAPEPEELAPAALRAQGVVVIEICEVELRVPSDVAAERVAALVGALRAAQ